MSNVAILGNFFGDEGKGHITHHFSKDFDWIIRFAGGANAGHTIYRDGVKYVHNLMPSFDWRSSKPKAFLSSGMVIDLEQLHLEVKKLHQVDSNLPQRVYVDPDAFIVLPEYKEQDKKQNAHIGSTNRGIGPAYTAKISRRGTRIRDLLTHSDDPTIDHNFIEEMKQMGVHFKGLLELRNQFMQDKLLFEGAQGVMLDINHGTYPYVTSSDATIAGIYSCGFHFARPDKVYGVAKAYATRVGEGPFPTEIFGDEATKLRDLGHEYGSTTGRPRRVGWLDLPALDYACKMGGVNSLILTKFDILNGYPDVKVCDSYKTVPMSSADFKDATPHYVHVKSWNNAKNKEELKSFINLVEQTVNCPVEYVSCGTSSSDIMSW